jgi:ABC-type cobalamin transport system permease subunit
MDPMPSWNEPIKSPYIFLILGVLSISAAVVFTCMGKVWVRLNGWVYRAKEPKWFWWEVALDYLIGVCFIGYCLYRAYGLSQ